MTRTYAYHLRSKPADSPNVSIMLIVEAVSYLQTLLISLAPCPTRLVKKYPSSAPHLLQEAVSSSVKLGMEDPSQGFGRYSGEYLQGQGVGYAEAGLVCRLCWVLQHVSLAANDMAYRTHAQKLSCPNRALAAEKQRFGPFRCLAVAVHYHRSSCYLPCCAVVDRSYDG
jgi:hypothetical protein